jgi:hypothetical protein
MGFTSHIFGLLGLQGLKVQMRFGEEIVERSDRFVVSETAQARVAAMYDGLREVKLVGEDELVGVAQTARRMGTRFLGSS